MVASTITDVVNADVANTSSSLELGCASSVPCSICLDLVIDDGERSISKLHCGHKFHLDCIGSAFNMKGTMQCPNCRKVESGRWLFADGSADAISETEAQDWIPNEGSHELNYSRRPFGFHWCPFSGFTFHSSLEEAESSLNTFTNFHGNHAMITENTASPALARPYISSYLQPSEHVGNSNLQPLNALSGPHTNLYVTNIQHPSWGWSCHFVPYSVDREYIDHGNLAPVNHGTLRVAQADAVAVARSPSFLHPSHYTRLHVSRTGETLVGNSQSYERIPSFQSSHHQEHPSDITNMPSSTNVFRRHGGVRDHGFYVHETESSYNHARERDHILQFPVIPGPYLHRVPDFSSRNQWF